LRCDAAGRCDGALGCRALGRSAAARAALVELRGALPGSRVGISAGRVARGREVRPALSTAAGAACGRTLASQ
jgi:hypothetical protein